ncbi:MAG: membrane protein insertase YidC [Gemmatimonadaceae bacterium]|nr:membrane protein insertase YidC [Gemmatimonadaceae bacterium]
MTRRIILAALLIGIVLWLTPILFPTPKTPPRAGSVLPPSATSGTPSGVAATAGTTTSVGSTTGAAAPNAPVMQGASASTPAMATARPETTTIVGPRAELRFSSLGATFIGATMKDYRSLQRNGSANVELARPNEPLLTYAIATSTDTIPLAGTPFTTRRLGDGAVEYDAATRAGQVTLRYAIVPDSYVVRVAGTLQGAPAGSNLLVALPQGLRSAEADTVDDARHLAIAYKRKTDDAKGVSFSRVDPGKQELIPGPITWAVTKSKYFLVAVAARDTAHPFGPLTITGLPRASKAVTHMAGTLQVPLGDGGFSFDVYAGPQEWRRLRALGRDLDTANPYGGFLQGIVQPFATLVMRALLWLHETFRMSYGWVLVLFGVMIRLLTWPLNQSAMRTSLKMQRIQPELQELQKKYRSDPQRLNAEMMRLYKEHDMSPFSSLAGCMPMLIPMPILFALFFVFQNTIEFRGVPFLWLPDISLRDPYYILPVLMGISMFLLSWIGMRGVPPNPQAKMMAYVMPIVMTVIFFRFPAGLNLYYTVQNIVTIPQQWMLSKERAKANLRPVVSTPAPARVRRGSQA